MKPITILAFLACLHSPALAETILTDGKYITEGASCDRQRAEGDWVFIQQNHLSMTHLECDLTSEVRVKRMDAALYDGTCELEGVPENARFFIAKESVGIFIYAPSLMSERLRFCPL